jgi:hypothetical protein
MYQTTKHGTRQARARMAPQCDLGWAGGVDGNGHIAATGKWGRWGQRINNIDYMYAWVNAGSDSGRGREVA